MKVAVIGAGGFVGAQVVKRLSADPDVTEISMIDRVDMPKAAKARAFRGDFSDPVTRDAALDGVDAVIFLAAILGGTAEADYALARRINVDETLTLFDWLRDRNPALRMVFASTIAVYGKPMPDPVTDHTPADPTMVYGAQKLMMEVALTNFARKGWLDGVSLRPSGVLARDGADAGLKTAFMSRLFWCVRRGEDITLPVAEDSRSWFSGVDTVAANFIHAAKLPDIGHARAFTLPALSITYAELVAALRARFPDSPSTITFAPDPEIVSLFGSYPNLETETADRLGFIRDTEATALIDSAMV